MGKGVGTVLLFEERSPPPPLRGEEKSHSGNMSLSGASHAVTKIDTLLIIVYSSSSANNNL